MKTHPPQPYVQAFVVCREIFEDHHSGDYLLFAPRRRFQLSEFPGSIEFAVYAHLTELHGKYASSCDSKIRKETFSGPCVPTRRSSTTTRSCPTASHFAT